MNKIALFQYFKNSCFFKSDPFNTPKSFETMTIPRYKYTINIQYLYNINMSK